FAPADVPAPAATDTTAAPAEEWNDLGELFVPPSAVPAVSETVAPAADAEPAGVELSGLFSEDTAGQSQENLSDLDNLLGDVGTTPVAPPPAPVTAPPPAPVAKPKAAPQRSRRRKAASNPTMRVEVKHLDTINNLVGELVVNRNSLEQIQGRLQQFLDNLLFRVRSLNDMGQKLQDRYERSLLEASLMAGRNSVNRPSVPTESSGSSDSNGSGHSTGAEFDALEMDQFTAFHTLSQDIIEQIVRIRESSSDIQYVVDESELVSRQFRQVTSQVQESLNRARMVPFSQIADRLPRAVRDLSIKSGKQIDLMVEGRDTLIDKAILEELYDPMTHLVNNAIVHGVETPEVRQERGKGPEGTITIETY
ncbi:MAG: hybrid sensor histidine kinase/response regulator, partial [Cyanobacteria bacterium J06648_11]